MPSSPIFTTAGGITFLQFPNLSGMPGLRHGIFTRHGGVSRGAFGSLNMGLGTGDAPENVQQNRQRAARCLSARHMVFAHQVHGTKVLKIEDTHPPGAPLTGDALMTDRPGLFVAVQVADCQPVLLFDPKKRAVAAVHSGWRGSVKNVIGRSVCALVDTYGCRPRDIQAGIGPSLGPCCGEFVNYRKELPEAFWQYKGPGHRFDFWAISRDQLVSCGVPEQNIYLSRLCTRCRSDLFFSYRGEGTTGRFMAAIGLAETGESGLSEGQ